MPDTEPRLLVRLRRWLGRRGAGAWAAVRSWPARAYDRLDLLVRALYAFFRRRYPILGALLLLGAAVLGWRAITAYVEPASAADRSGLVQGVAQLVAGLLLLGGLYFTARTLRVSQETLRLNEQGQVTERFTRAIEHLGSDRLEVRLGGIYALERIARDSARDHWPVMEVLTAYVREHAGCHGEQKYWLSDRRAPHDLRTREGWRAPADVQAILTVIGRRERTFGNGEDLRLDLADADLRHAHLYRAHLEGADLAGSDLGGWANLSGAHLEGAVLRQANLQGVVLIGACLREADLREARMRSADLRDAWMEEADLRAAHLAAANFGSAHLQSANLSNAQLRRAAFYRADLSAAKLRGAKTTDPDRPVDVDPIEWTNFEMASLKQADLHGADLRWAQGLTVEQAMEAKWDETTLWPAYLPNPPGDPTVRPTP